ncbi:MAG: ABC transporter permease [Chitinophagaceae bacterium]|nr:ABC transporter permease [Chitinophagaceae bacterium]
MQWMIIEWYKLRKYTAFWLLVGLFAGLFLLWNFGLSRSFINMGSGPAKLISSSYSFPSVWGNMGFVYSWFIIFLSVFVIMSVTNEFSFRTHRQHVIDGLRRIDFLHGKLMMVFLLSLSATVFYTLSALVFGMLNGGGNPLDEINKVAYVFIYTLNYLTLSALLGFFIRRSALSIILLFAYMMFENSFGMFINWRFETQIGNLLPLQSSDELLPWPMLQSMKSMVPGKVVKSISPVVYFGFSVMYIGLYYFLMRRKMLKTDL